MKYKITEEEHKALPEAAQKEYNKTADGFVLNVEGLEDTTKIKETLERVKSERADFLEKLKGKTSEYDKLVEERDNILKGAIPKSDVEKLEGSYKSKVAKLEEESKAKFAALENQIRSSLVDGTISKLAAKLSKNTELMSLYLKTRVTSEVDAEGKIALRVLDKNGAPSALTLDELEKEVLDNPSLKSIVVASSASGGGAPGAPSGGAEGNEGKNKIDMRTASPKEIAAYLKNKGKLRSPGDVSAED
jgi:hypothetical protein